jgi:predicted transcriptional regulator
MPKIIEIARTNLIKTSNLASFQEVANLMISNNVGSVIIFKNNKIIGLIDDNTIIRLIAQGKNPLELKIEDYIKRIPTLKSDMDILDAWDFVQNKPEERWGVKNEKDEIIGIIRKRTINDFKMRILKEELNIED